MDVHFPCRAVSRWKTLPVTAEGAEGRGGRGKILIKSDEEERSGGTARDVADCAAKGNSMLELCNHCRENRIDYYSVRFLDHVARDYVLY